MKKQVLYAAAALAASVWIAPGLIESVSAAVPPPIVFQASGPNAASIQSMVDAFRAALGNPNNGNDGIPHPSGRREINWDGGSTSNTATSLGPTPFDVFLNGRGARFTTPGTGFVQAPPSGLATTFGNPSYTGIFTAFSLQRLFSPIGSNVTHGLFFLPGGGEIPATVSGFGAVFTDVDRTGPTTIRYFDAQNNLLAEQIVPGSIGTGGLSFAGVLFETSIVARVRIQTGTRAPGLDDNPDTDIVMIDDVLYGEPQRIIE